MPLIEDCEIFQDACGTIWQRLSAVLGRTGQGGTGHQSEGLMAGHWIFARVT